MSVVKGQGHKLDIVVKPCKQDKDWIVWVRICVLSEEKKRDLTQSYDNPPPPDTNSKASVTIVADFSPEINPPFRRRYKYQIKNHHAYQ